MQPPFTKAQDCNKRLTCYVLLPLQVDGESAPSQYVIDIEGGSHGQLGAGHLADHPAAVAALQGAVKVGDPLGALLVLERVEVIFLLFHACYCFLLACLLLLLLCRGFACMQQLFFRTRQGVFLWLRSDSL